MNAQPLEERPCTRTAGSSLPRAQPVLFCHLCLPDQVDQGDQVDQVDLCLPDPPCALTPVARQPLLIRLQTAKVAAHRKLNSLTHLHQKLICWTRCSRGGKPHRRTLPASKEGVSPPTSWAPGAQSWRRGSTPKAKASTQDPRPHLTQLPRSAQPSLGILLLPLWR